MSRSALRACACALLAAGAGCELVVPSDSDLSGGSTTADAGDANPPTPGDAGGADGGAASSLVQQTVASKSSTPTLVLTLPTPPRDGSALVITVGAFGTAGSATPTLAVSGGGVTWTQSSRSSVHVVSAVFVGLPVASGTTSVTVKASDTQIELAAHLSEWAGLGTFRDARPTNGVGAPATASLAVADGATLVYASAATAAVQLGPPANGFVDLPRVTSGKIQIVQGYRIAPPAGMYGTTWNEMSPSGAGWDAHVLSFAR